MICVRRSFNWCVRPHSLGKVWQFRNYVNCNLRCHMHLNKICCSWLGLALNPLSTTKSAVCVSKSCPHRTTWILELIPNLLRSQCHDCDNGSVFFAQGVVDEMTAQSRQHQLQSLHACIGVVGSCTDHGLQGWPWRSSPRQQRM